MELTVELIDNNTSSSDLLSMFHLRYKVYCEEEGFLYRAQYPNNFEFDEYDKLSDHFILKVDNDVIGTIRLVKWDNLLHFPSTRFFPELENNLKKLGYPLKNTAEISRLCILKKHRKHIIYVMSLFKVMYQVCVRNKNITHWIGAFDKYLYKLLTKYSITLEDISKEEIDYYGKVKIYGSSIVNIEYSVLSNNAKLALFFKGLSKTINL